MTKAQARRRLNEAQNKIKRVFADYTFTISGSDVKIFSRINNDINAMIKKLK